MSDVQLSDFSRLRRLPLIPERPSSGTGATSSPPTRFAAGVLAALVIAGSAASVLLRSAPPASQPPAAQPARNPSARYVPDDLQSIAWLEARRDEQVKAAASTPVFRDFQFTDRVAASGITFRHRI